MLRLPPEHEGGRPSSARMATQACPQRLNLNAPGPKNQMSKRWKNAELRSLNISSSPQKEERGLEPLSLRK